MIIVKYLKRRLKVRSFSLQTVLKYNNVEPVLIYVSVVVSNVRAVSEGMMIVISNSTKKSFQSQWITPSKCSIVKAGSTKGFRMILGTSEIKLVL